MPIGLASPDWSVEGETWPHHKHSAFVSVAGHRWHVQRWGSGSRVLLLHGTGASLHSFAALADRLGMEAEVMLLDLPGHGFTETPVLKNISLRTVSEDVGALLRASNFHPDVIIGHSAGAAIAHTIAQANNFTPDLVVSINGAFRSFSGLAKMMAPTLAKALYFNPLAAVMASKAVGTKAGVERLLVQTGSRIPEETAALYARLLRYPGHVSGALALMSGWALDGLEASIGASQTPSLLIVGDDDQTVSPEVSVDLAAQMVGAAILRIPGAGHLVHEEKPLAVAEAILRAMPEALSGDRDVASGGLRP